MSELFVKEIHSKKSVSLDEASYLLEKHVVTNPVQVMNWKNFNYRPQVNFRIGHIKNEIWLKYYVRERHIRAMETRTNGEVYKDSCVEFFIIPAGENYYNFEFNCIGTIHLAWGPGRHGRKFVDPSVIERIEVKSSLGNQPFDNRTGDFEWEMMIRIPVECFSYSKIKTLRELSARANFYKCGDETAEPHYVTWNPVGTENPDYHRPEFFGKVFFE
ncbi:MAG: hypothetical protein JXA03_01645 [Bacteroidales bacterium]|nr:hypothetical protein [Bacteroidales bacterium]